MTLISLEDAKAEVRKVVPDFKTRYDINYRLNNLPSIELEEDRKTEPTISKMEQVEDEPKTQMKTQKSNLSFEKADEPQTDCAWK